jgi:nucleoside 2-deoxyribosyltransferase
MLLVGEVFVDFNVTEPGRENKLRLGGIAHAARAFWALEVPFSAAAILPEYLERLARNYFAALGCVDFHVIGRVRGAPNITAIFDIIELADQGYETLLREEKEVELLPSQVHAKDYNDILVFPGTYDLLKVCRTLTANARIHLDVAYDLDELEVLAELPQRVLSILISTSSPLFQSLADKTIIGLVERFSLCDPVTLILKENRGGARRVKAGKIEALPAQLGTTRNSVGVGDVFAATYVAFFDRDNEAAWRATYAASAYAQTTDPDLFKKYVQRDLKLGLSDMQQLGGVALPWERLGEHPIYLAAPDFSHGDRRAIDKVLASLSYHNFCVRRPIVENGELPTGAGPAELQRAYRADYDLIKSCSLVFAVPTDRDPGTLVEMGIAIESGIPVVVYDPEFENANTMVMAGADQYSTDLDECLNAVFRTLSRTMPQ